MRDEHSCCPLRVYGLDVYGGAQKAEMENMYTYDGVVMTRRSRGVVAEGLVTATPNEQDFAIPKDRGDAWIGAQ